MAQDILVTELEIGERFVREFAQCKPVHAAFWLRESDGDRYYLYIAADDIGGAGYDGYREVVRLAPQFKSPFFDMFRIRLIRPDDPLARAVIELQEQFPDPMLSRLGPYMLGGQFVEDGYLYPPLHSAVGQP